MNRPHCPNRQRAAGIDIFQKSSSFLFGIGLCSPSLLCRCTFLKFLHLREVLGVRMSSGARCCQLHWTQWNLVLSREKSEITLSWSWSWTQVKFLSKEPTVFRAWPKASGNQPAFLFDAVIICGSTGTPVLNQGTGRKRLTEPKLPSLYLIYADAKVCSLRTVQI